MLSPWKSLHVCTQSASALFPLTSQPDLTSSHSSLATLLWAHWSVGYSSYIPHILLFLGLCICRSLCQQHPSTNNTLPPDVYTTFSLTSFRFLDNITLREAASDYPRQISTFSFLYCTILLHLILSDSVHITNVNFYIVYFPGECKLH